MKVRAQGWIGIGLISLALSACVLDLTGLDDGQLTGVGGAGGSGGPPVQLRLQYRTPMNNIAVDTKIEPELDIINDGLTDVSLDDVTVRYWYTLDGASPMEVLFCDFATPPVSCAELQQDFNSYNQPGANRYLELSFTGGLVLLSQGGRTHTIDLRIQHPQTDMDETNDYSYDNDVATQEEWKDWERITVYYQGQLVWGTEP